MRPPGIGGARRAPGPAGRYRPVEGAALRDLDVAAPDGDGVDLRYDWRGWGELDRDGLYAVLALRQRVFVVEQHCAYLDADGADSTAVHLLGWSEDALVAYLRVLPPVNGAPPRIGRVLTAPEVRGHGLARPLMREGMREARARFGPGPIRIEAQAHLVDLYASLGFAAIGAAYDEDGIPHVPMLAR